MERIPFRQIELKEGFWQKKQQLNRYVTVAAVLNRFMETGRFEAFKCNWREGMANKPHIFWDSDVAKWIEAVAYLMEKEAVPELESIVEATVDAMEKQQTPDGYLNSYFTGMAPAERWSDRRKHELYCAGHLMEAAVAWYRATGRDRFLRMMCRYADYIEKVFTEENSAAFMTPGHQEIELALVRLYRATGEKRYLELSRRFIDLRGSNGKDFEEEASFELRSHCQSHLPCREQETAEGHSVRACYMYSAMADLAREYKDEKLASACERIFENITKRRMYITGGIGSAQAGERFTVDYHLPNELAYTETCAAISLVFFAQRMLLISPDAKYADVVERVLYNGFLSGLSLDGKLFFYTNPLEINLINHRAALDDGCHQAGWLPITQRVEVFDCSCCPPNINRLLASLGDYIYTKSEDCFYMHQYMPHWACLGEASVQVETDYPVSGKIGIHINGMNGKRLALRIPGWCTDFSLNVPYEKEKGYAVIACQEDMQLSLEMKMQPTLIEANPFVTDNACKAAVMRGPVVYCAEADPEERLQDWQLDGTCELTEGDAHTYGVPVLYAGGWQRQAQKTENWLYRPMCSLRQEKVQKLIPYFAFANAGEKDMRVWFPLKG